MKSELRIDLDDLSFDLWYKQKGQYVRHMFNFNDPERAAATLVTKRYEYAGDDLKCVGSVSETVTIESHKETKRGARLCWALKGIWGLPTNYDSEETQS